MCKNKVIKVNFSELESGNKIIKNWYLIVLFFFVLPSIFFFNYLISMIFSESYIIYLASFAIFSFCLYHNFEFTKNIAKEFDSLKEERKTLSVNHDFNNSNENSLFYKHIAQLKAKNILSKKIVSQDSLIEIMSTKLTRKNYITSLFSGILITFGLIGTIIGLITTVTGLEGALQSATENNDLLFASMSTSLGGMGTAFYTTLVGSLLGGVVLKILHVYSNNKAISLVAEIAEVTDIKYLPLLNSEIDRVQQVGMFTHSNKE